MPCDLRLHDHLDQAREEHEPEQGEPSDRAQLGGHDELARADDGADDDEPGTDLAQRRSHPLGGSR